MEEDCAFFIELYRLQDQEREDGVSISDEQFRYLAELCTFCGLCPWRPAYFAGCSSFTACPIRFFIRLSCWLGPIARSCPEMVSVPRR